MKYINYNNIINENENKLIAKGEGNSIRIRSICFPRFPPLPCLFRDRFAKQIYCRKSYRETCHFTQRV